MSLRSAISTFRGNRVPRFNIIGKWRWWFGLSGAIIVISLIALSVRGLNFSIEFKGGSVLQFANRSGASVADYQAIMDRFGLSGSEVELVSGGTGCPTGCI